MDTTVINSLYTLLCTGLMALIFLGIGYFYSGLTHRRSALSMIAVPMVIAPFILLDWFIWGYSLSYSPSSNRFIGNMGYVVLKHLSANPIYESTRGSIFGVCHFLYTAVFKIVTAAFIFPGCIVDRGRLGPMLLFMVFFWSPIIYNPVTYWFWNPNGWLSVELDKWPVLDFAGGNCVHIVSGFTALAYSYSLGHRNPSLLQNIAPSSTGNILVGTYLIVVGWTGFIAGSGVQFGHDSTFIFVGTLLSASVSGVVWMALDYYFSAIPLDDDDYGLTATFSRVSFGRFRAHRRQLSMVSFSSGLISGLVVFTPAGGYVSSANEVWKPIVFGALAGLVCNISTRVKYWFDIDDALDIFAIHGVAGILGSVLTAFLASKHYGAKGGWVEHHWIQLGYQLLGCTVTSAYVFVMSIVGLYLIDWIPGCYLRIDKGFNTRARSAEPVVDEGCDLELQGQDEYQYGEYLADYMQAGKKHKV